MGVETKRVSRSRRWLAPGIIAALVTLGGFAPGVEAQRARGAAGVEVEGTQFKVTLPDGRVLRSPELGGAVLDLRSGLRVRIDAVEEGRDSRGGPLWLHTLSMRQADGTWASFCRLGPDGRRAGFPVPGRATADGMVAEAEPGVFELTCYATCVDTCPLLTAKMATLQQRLGKDFGRRVFFISVTVDPQRDTGGAEALR